MSLEIKDLSCAVDRFRLMEINLSVKDKSYFILLGPTGAGKSTLLKCILGINRSQTGTIILDGRDITRAAVEERNIGYLPQNCALFPHLDVRENISFGMRVNNASEAAIKKNTARLLSLFAIEHLVKRNPKNLSGGEKQKVALARALGTRPALLLLDEPFSAVDEGSRRSLWFELKNVFQEINVPVIHVTHNFDEAYTMGERIGVMADGRLQQVADARTLFERPATREVARFLHYRNFFSGPVSRQGNDRYRLDCRGLTIIFSSQRQLSGTVTLCIRPQDIKIINPNYPIKAELAENVYDAAIQNVILYPESAVLFVTVDGSTSDDYDFELKFPLYIFKRYQLHEHKRIQVALWQPSIIILDD